MITGTSHNFLTSQQTPINRLNERHQAENPRAPLHNPNITTPQAANNEIKIIAKNTLENLKHNLTQSTENIIIRTKRMLFLIEHKRLELENIIGESEAQKYQCPLLLKTMDIPILCISNKFNGLNFTIDAEALEKLTSDKSPLCPNEKIEKVTLNRELLTSLYEALNEQTEKIYTPIEQLIFIEDIEKRYNFQNLCSYLFLNSALTYDQFKRLNIIIGPLMSYPKKVEELHNHTPLYEEMMVVTKILESNREINHEDIKQSVKTYHETKDLLSFEKNQESQSWNMEEINDLISDLEDFDTKDTSLYFENKIWKKIYTQFNTYSKVKMLNQILYYQGSLTENNKECLGSLPAPNLMKIVKQLHDKPHKWKMISNAIKECIQYEISSTDRTSHPSPEVRSDWNFQNAQSLIELIKKINKNKSDFKEKNLYRNLITLFDTPQKLNIFTSLMLLNSFFDENEIYNIANAKNLPTTIDLIIELLKSHSTEKELIELIAIISQTTQYKLNLKFNERTPFPEKLEKEKKKIIEKKLCNSVKFAPLRTTLNDKEFWNSLLVVYSSKERLNDLCESLHEKNIIHRWELLMLNCENDTPVIIGKIKKLLNEKLSKHKHFSRDTLIAAFESNFREEFSRYYQ